MMKVKIVYLILSCMVVMALVLASCGPAEEEEGETQIIHGQITQTDGQQQTTTQQQPTSLAAEMVTLNLTKLDGTKVTKTVEKPQYGGTIKACCIQQTQNFDPAGKGLFLDPTIQYNVYEGLTTFNWTRGPAGTGEVEDVGITSGDEYWIPWLAESFEIIDPRTFSFKIRKGILFHDKPPANGRELTVDDVVESILRCSRVRGGARIKESNGDKVYAVDDETVVIEMANLMLAPVQNTKMDMWIYASETVNEDDMIPWKDICATGPYMVQDYISGTSATLIKHNNYWANDPLIPENQLPYADKIVTLFISEPATRLAAVRTGKIDRIVGLNWEEAESLETSAEGLSMEEGPGTLSYTLYFRIDKEPFNDINVRKALTIAVDRRGILEGYLEGHGLLDWDPIRSDTVAYTPLEDQPQDIQELYEYNPEEARQLLADAGYSEGFTIDILYSDRPMLKDYALTIEKYWEAIGVDAEPRLIPFASYKGEAYARTYDTLLWESGGGGSYYPFYSGHTTHSSGARFSYFWGVDDKGLPTWSDPEWDSMLLKANNATYPDPGYEMQKECGIAWQRKIYTMPMPLASSFTAWWPWLKGYYGEVGNGQTFSFEAMYPHCWIDQNLKAEMTGSQ